jgi:aromatic-L-amino-acid decarboxylase
MFMPFACGALLVREGAKVLRAAFDITPEYLSEEREHLSGRDVEYDFFRYGQLGTRRFNALKIWMALQHLGVRGYASIIERQIELASYLAARIDSLENFRRVGPIHAAVCCFRFIPEAARASDGETLDRLQMALQQRIERGGAAWFSTTVLHGRRALRVNINSFLTEQRHIDDLLELLGRESANLTLRQT